jgi:hypothetical protein
MVLPVEEQLFLDSVSSWATGGSLLPLACCNKFSCSAEDGGKDIWSVSSIEEVDIEVFGDPDKIRFLAILEPVSEHIAEDQAFQHSRGVC